MASAQSHVRDRVSADVDEYLSQERQRAAEQHRDLRPQPEGPARERMVDQWLLYDVTTALRTLDLRRYMERRDDSPAIRLARARLRAAVPAARVALRELGDALAALARAERDWRG